jgi:hypothetical protein
VKAKERIVIGTEVFRLGSASGGAIEHAAHRHAINACAPQWVKMVAVAAPF